MKLKKFILSIICTTAAIISSVPVFAYNDINGHWAEGYINEMKSSNVLGQFEDNEFKPDRPLNRAECAELISDFLSSFYGFKQHLNPEDYKFPDLTYGTRNTMKIDDLAWYTYESYMTSDFYNNDSSAIRNSKIINGYPDGTFQPYNNVTRAEFAKMLINALDCFGYIPSGNGETFGDHYYHWANKHLFIALGLNIMNGYGSEYKYIPEINDYGNYIIMKPDNNITRAEAVKMLSSAKSFNFSEDTRRSGPSKMLFFSWGDSLKWESMNEAIDFYESLYKQSQYSDRITWENYDRNLWSIVPEYTYDNIITLHWRNISGHGGSYYQFIKYGGSVDILMYDGNASFPKETPYTINVDSETMEIIDEGYYGN